MKKFSLSPLENVKSIISYIKESRRKKDADYWADRAEFMEDKNSDGGMVFEEVPMTLRQKGMRRGLFAGNVIAQRIHDDYASRKLPKGLVQGNTFWGQPGGRSSRGVGTAKSMNKSISTLNQNGTRHVVGGFKGSKMSKAMDVNTKSAKLPSTKRVIRQTDKYFN